MESRIQDMLILFHFPFLAQFSRLSDWIWREIDTFSHISVREQQNDEYTARQCDDS